jgi:hypothetical protein
MSHLFSRFRTHIAAAALSELRSDITLGGTLALDKQGPLTVSYAPLDFINHEARIVILGIRPGAKQAGEALAEAHRHLIMGADDGTALRAAKAHASFSGAMRDSLVSMLDHVGLHRRLNIPTSARLWDTDSKLAHFTSALRYPVFYKGENYRGTPSMTGTPLLRRYLAEYLAQEALALPQALWFPCGSTAAKGVRWLVTQRVLSPDQVCDGLLHPSTANVERGPILPRHGPPSGETLDEN